MRDQEAFRKGAQLRREILGEPEKELKPGRLEKWLEEFRDEEIVHIWGTYWTRTGSLDQRSRAIVALTCLVNLGYEEDLAPLIRGLVKNRILTRVEIREVIMQCPGYIGYPKTLAARKCAQRVFAEKEL